MRIRLCGLEKISLFCFERSFVKDEDGPVSHRTGRTILLRQNKEGPPLPARTLRATNNHMPLPLHSKIVGRCAWGQLDMFILMHAPDDWNLWMKLKKSFRCAVTCASFLFTLEKSFHHQKPTSGHFLSCIPLSLDFEGRNRVSFTCT